MEVIVLDNYIQLTKIDGIVMAIAINHSGVWSEIPLDPNTLQFDELHPLTIELRQWEKVNGAIDLSKPPPPPEPDVAGLAAALRGTEVFNKVYQEAKLNPRVQVPFNLLTSTLNASNPDLKDLEFALTEVKNEMEEKLIATDVQFVNSALAVNYFTFVL